MLYGVIDVGSNSVRLLISDGKKSLYKKVITTRLGEGLGNEKLLKDEPIDRTVKAINLLSDLAKEQNVDKLFTFATAAVRSANNKEIFLDKVKEFCGIEVEVLSGETEAKIGALGVLGELDGGIVDVGGASTEILLIKAGKPEYLKSFDIGAVKLKDNCGQDIKRSQEYLDNVFPKKIQANNYKIFGIGGTATSLASIIQELDPYDPSKVDGFIISVKELKSLSETLFSLTIDEKKKLKGLQPERAEVIASGVLILYNALNVLGVDEIIVSERDNLEGYLLDKIRYNA